VPPSEGDPLTGEISKKTHQYYWLYSSASFGDFTGDSKPDLIVGGRELRISKNIGTATAPVFAQRELLMDLQGNPLQVYQFTPDELKFYDDRKTLGYIPPISGDEKLTPYAVDWDNDGILDLLVTNSFYHKGLHAVTFFKGAKVGNDHRFYTGVPLFKARDTGKSIPGSGPRISVVDWNDDGIRDLLIGASVVTMKNEFNGRFSWTWEEETGLLGAGKDPATLTDLPADILNLHKASLVLPPGITIDEYMTIRHQGYIYVMIGRQKKLVNYNSDKKVKKEKK